MQEIFDYNKDFVKNKEYLKYETNKYPSKNLAIVTCMDTRLIELLPAALGIKNGDAKIIKNAGGVISHPYGSVVRSLLVAILELGVDKVMVIGHTDCGVQSLNSEKMIGQMIERGVKESDFEILKYSGIDFEKWLGGFDGLEETVVESVHMLKTHPLIPKDVEIGGYVMDSLTGELSKVTE